MSELIWEVKSSLRPLIFSLAIANWSEIDLLKSEPSDFRKFKYVSRPSPLISELNFFPLKKFSTAAKASKANSLEYILL